MALIVSASSFFGNILPSEWIDPLEDGLDLIGIDIEASRVVWTQESLSLEYWLHILEDLRMDFPLIPGAALEFEGSETGILLKFQTKPKVEFALENMDATLTFPADILRAYHRNDDGKWEPLADEDGNSLGLALRLTLPFLKVDMDGNFQVSSPELNMESSALMIGDTGLLLDFTPSSEADPSIPPFELVLSPREQNREANGEMDEDLSTPVTAEDTEGVPSELTQKGSTLPDDFRGIKIRRLGIYYLNNDANNMPPLFFEEAAIGNGGFSGVIGIGSLANADRIFTNEELTEGALGDDVWQVEIAGMRIILLCFALRLQQSLPVESRIAGYTFLPFADRWVRLEASLNGPRGDFMVSVGGTSNQGLIDLDTDIFKITVDSIAYQNREGINYAIISGGIQLKVPEGLNMPEFKAEKISISERGDIEIEGGWIRAPQQVNIDLHGFKIGIREIGLGNEGKEGAATRRQWIGFSGEVQLVEGLPIKGSVDGLKISWLQSTGDDIQVSLRGIGVDFTIPGTLSFSGAVSYDERTNLFKGNIRLNLIALRTEIEGQLMIGKYRDAEGREFGVFYIALSAQLPTAIPLAATGTGLYGIRGLAGVNVAPDKEQEEAWYEWYKSGEGEESYSVSHVNKWAPMFDNYAFGAGISLGTIYDDGTTINMNAMLVVLIPGPVIMLEGRANLLKQRSDSKSEEGAFYLLAVLDGRAGTFQLNIDIRYSLEDIVSVGGGMEAFFDFNNGDNWHIWIGQKDPEAKRIRAEILSLFSVSVYFMIDPNALMFGASAGLNINETYGPVTLRIIVRLSLDAAIFFKPFQLEGSFQFLMDLNVAVFGIGLRLYLEALLSGKTPNPFEVYGKAKLVIGLFWPLPNIECEVEFRWEKPADTLPAWPLLKAIGESSFSAPNPTLRRVAVMQHHKSSELRVDLCAMPAGSTPTLADINIAPIDSRPALTFAKKLHYLGNQLVNPEPDRPGNGEFWYHLTDIRLEQSVDGTSWELIRHGINNAGTKGLPFFKINVTEDPENGDGYFQNGNNAEEPVLELWKYHVWDRLNLYQRQTQPNETPPCGKKGRQGEMYNVDWSTETPRNLPAEFGHQGLFFVTDVVANKTSEKQEFHEPYIGNDDPRNTKIPNVNRLRTRSLTIHFPEKCTNVVVFIYFDRLDLLDGSIQDDISSLKGEAFYQGNRVPASKKAQQVGYYLVVTFESADGFDSIRIQDKGSSDEAFWINNILYKTADEFVAKNVATEQIQTDDATRRNGFTRQTPLLRPDTFYRLSVTTKVSGSKSAEEVTDLYFRTDAGPGIPFDPRNPGIGIAYGPELAEDQSIKSVGNPVAQFSSYVAGTCPAHGGIAHYRDEVITVGFNEKYLLKMFEGRQLILRIRDRNGNYLPVSDPFAKLLAMPLFIPGLMTWHTGLKNGECGSEDPQAQMMPGLSFKPGVRLNPNTQYYAELTVALPQQRNPHVLFDFQFTSSRYASFREHFGVLGTEVKPIQVNRVSITESTNQSSLNVKRERYLDELKRYNELVNLLNSDTEGPLPGHREVAETYEKVGLLKQDWETLSSELFEKLESQTLAAFEFRIEDSSGREEYVDMRHRGLPPEAEIIAIPLNGSSQRLLLFESPEPVDWAGISGTLREYSNGRTLPLNFICNRDKTRAFFVRAHSLSFHSERIQVSLKWIPFNKYALSVQQGEADSSARNAEFWIL